ncbi:MAG: CoA transferase, partial [Dehalococcoidia bacterium]
CVINVLMNAAQFWDLERLDVPRSGNAWVVKGITTQLGWRCKDGYVESNVLGGMAHHIRSNRAIVAWMAEDGVAPEWLKEFDWEKEFDSTRVSQETVDKVLGELRKFFLIKTKQELWEGALKRDFFLAPIYDASEIAAFPQLEARGFWIRVPHPELNDTLTYCHPPNRLSETPCEIRRRAPLLGEDNEDIYVGMLGLTMEEMLCLKGGDVI